MVKIVLTRLPKRDSNRQELPGIVKESGMSPRVLGRTGSTNERKVLRALDALELDYGQNDRGLPQYARRASRNCWIVGSPSSRSSRRTFATATLSSATPSVFADVTPRRHTLDER